VVFLKNHTSTKTLNGQTPYKVVNLKPPDLQDLPEWGCKVWVHDEKTGKVGTRAQEGHWVGYDDMSAVHRIYWPDKKSMGVKRNVKFSVTYEATPYYDAVLLEGEDVELDEPTTSKPNNMTPSDPPTHVPAPTPVNKPNRCSTCTQKPSQYIKDIQSRKGGTQGWKNQPVFPQGMVIPEATIEEVPDNESTNDQGELMEEIPSIAMAAKMAEAHGMELRNLVEAKRSPDWTKWQEAMEVECQVLEKFGTWHLEKPPPNMNIVGCHWTFVSQIPRVNFFKTHAPVAKIASMHVLFAMAAHHNFKII